jgi:hypothetical protein
MRRTSALQEVRLMRFEILRDRHERGELSRVEAAELPGVGERTFRRWRDRHGEVVAAHAIFCPLYTDRGGLYFHTPKAGERVSKTARRVGGEGADRGGGRTGRGFGVLGKARAIGIGELRRPPVG